MQTSSSCCLEREAPAYSSESFGFCRFFSICRCGVGLSDAEHVLLQKKLSPYFVYSSFLKVKLCIVPLKHIQVSQWPMAHCSTCNSYLCRVCCMQQEQYAELQASFWACWCPILHPSDKGGLQWIEEVLCLEGVPASIDLLLEASQ